MIAKKIIILLAIMSGTIHAVEQSAPKQNHTRQLQGLSGHWEGFQENVNYQSSELDSMNKNMREIISALPEYRQKHFLEQMSQLLKMIQENSASHSLKMHNMIEALNPRLKELHELELARLQERDSILGQIDETEKHRSELSKKHQVVSKTMGITEAGKWLAAAVRPIDEKQKELVKRFNEGFDKKELIAQKKKELMKHEGRAVEDSVAEGRKILAVSMQQVRDLVEEAKQEVQKHRVPEQKREAIDQQAKELIKHEGPAVKDPVIEWGKILSEPMQQVRDLVEEAEQEVKQIEQNQESEKQAAAYLQ